MGIAAEWGCDVPFRRPADISCDTSSSLEVVIHAFSHFPQYKYVVLLQPTSPLRSAKDIDDAFALMIQSKAPSCVSVCTRWQHPLAATY